MLVCHLVHLVPFDHNMVLVDQLSSVKQLQGEQYLSLIKSSYFLKFFWGKLTRFSCAYFALQIHNICISSLTSIISLYAQFLPEDEAGHISRSGPPRSQPLGRPGSPHTYQEKRGQASSKKRGHLIQYV